MNIWCLEMLYEWFCSKRHVHVQGFSLRQSEQTLSDVFTHSDTCKFKTWSRRELSNVKFRTSIASAKTRTNMGSAYSQTEGYAWCFGAVVSILDAFHIHIPARVNLVLLSCGSFHTQSLATLDCKSYLLYCLEFGSIWIQTIWLGLLPQSCLLLQQAQNNST